MGCGTVVTLDRLGQGIWAPLRLLWPLGRRQGKMDTGCFRFMRSHCFYLSFLFLVSKALATSSDALVPTSFLLLQKAFLASPVWARDVNTLH